MYVYCCFYQHRSFSITSTRKCVYPVPSLLNDTTENNDTLEESKPSLSDIQQEDGKIKIIQLKYELLLLIRTSFKLSFYQLYVLMCICFFFIG